MNNKDYIYKYFTPLSLAVWIMDDGTNQNGHIKLCTDSFTLEDVEWLQYLLLNKYNIHTTLHAAKNRSKDPNLKFKLGEYRIYVKAMSMPTLIKLVKPYIIPSMKYKLGTSFTENETIKFDNSIKIKVLDLKTNTFKIYLSTSLAANDLKLHQSSLSRYIRKNLIHPFKGRYIITQI